MLLIASFLAVVFLAFQWKKDWREVGLIASLVMGLLIAIGTEGLSLLGAISQGGLRWFWGIMLLMLAAVIVIWRKRWKLPKISFNLPKMHWLDVLLLIGVVVLVLMTALTAYQAPPNNWDSMVYHLPRVMHWLGSGSVDFYASHVQRQLFMSPGMEYIDLHVIGLTGSDQWVNMVGVLIWLGGAMLASLLAKELGADSRAQTLAAVLCLLIPTSLLQAGTPKNDLLLGFWMLAALISGLQFLKTPDTVHAAQLGAAIGLAILTKNTAVVLLAPFVVWVIAKGFIKLKGRFFTYGLIVTLMVVLLTAPHMLRSLSVYGSPLGPVEETSYYHNQTYGVRVLASNTVRNISMHFRGPAVWNTLMRKGIAGFHTLIGLDLSDPRTTWQGYTYDVYPLRFNEDELGAPLHVALFMLVMLLLLVGKKKIRKEQRSLLWFGLLITAAFLLFSGYLRWQLWQARLMAPMVMLASVVVGLVLAKRFPRWLVQAILVLMLLVGGVSVWKNPTKPLPVFYDYNIFNLKRPLAMIYDLSLQSDYMAAIEALEQNQQCREIGLVSDNADWEYPFWVFLGEGVHIEHVLVENTSAQLMDDGFAPCAVMVMTAERPETVTLPSGGTYFPVLETGELTLYSPSAETKE